MVRPHFVIDLDRVIDTMIALTRLSARHRAIVAGSDGMALYLSLRKRRFVWIATPRANSLPKEQHAVALISRRGQPSSIEAALDQVAPFLSRNAIIAVLISPGERGTSLKIRNKLEQMGFRIEAGVRCHEGLVLSACRHDVRQGRIKIKYAA